MSDYTSGIDVRLASVLSTDQEEQQRRRTALNIHPGGWSKLTAGKLGTEPENLDYGIESIEANERKKEKRRMNKMEDGRLRAVG